MFSSRTELPIAVVSLVIWLLFDLAKGHSAHVQAGRLLADK